MRVSYHIFPRLATGNLGPGRKDRPAWDKNWQICRHNLYNMHKNAEKSHKNLHYLHIWGYNGRT